MNNMNTRNACQMTSEILPRIGRFLFGIVLLAVLGFSAPVRGAAPPFTNAVVSHSTSKDDFPFGNAGSKYDPTGQYDNASGRLYHSGLAATWFLGKQGLAVNDKIKVPFTVPTDDDYTITLSGKVTGTLHSTGTALPITQHWGDFDVWAQPLTITGGSVLAGVGSTVIVSEHTALGDILQDVALQTVMQYVELPAAASTVLEAMDALESVAAAFQTVSQDITARKTVALKAGVTYYWECSLHSILYAQCAFACTHISANDLVLQIQDVSIVPAVPIQSLDLSPFSLDFGNAKPGLTLQKSLRLANTGNTVVNWSASSSASWLTVQSTSGSISPAGSQEVLVNVNTATLANGHHAATLTFNAGGTVIRIPISLTVVSSDGNFTIAANVANSDSEVDVTVRDSSGGLLWTKTYSTATLPISVAGNAGERVNVWAHSGVEKWFCTKWDYTIDGTPGSANANAITFTVGTAASVVTATAHLEQRYVITGRVVDKLTGKGIQGIHVHGDPYDEYTYADGSYYSGNNTPGTYTITVDVPAGYRAVSATSATLTVPPDHTAVDFVLIDNTPPPAPSVNSPSHPGPSNWYSAPSATLLWTAPEDVAGITEYCYAADFAPSTVPDPLMSAHTGDTTLTLTSLPEGVLYFHLRAKDNADNWGGAAHYVMHIDRSPPSLPTTLLSSTHGVGIPSPLTAISISWEGSSDSLSGVAGHTVVWSSESNTLPRDTFTRLGVLYGSAITSGTSPHLTSGSWYAHLRTIDTAGNVSASDAILGPFVIDPNALQPVNQLTDPIASGGAFRFTLSGPVGSNYVIQAWFSDFVNWLPLSTNTIPPSGSVVVTDPGATNYSRRFYRAILESELHALAGPRALYHFDEASGDTVVDSVGAWNGTLMNGATREASSPWGGSALKLDGVDDYVSIDQTLLHDLPRGTIVANIYYDPSNNEMFTIVSQGNTTYTALVFGIGTDGRPSAAMVSPSYQAQYLTSPDPVPMNTWVQLALTWDGAEWRIYVNGVPNGEVASTVTPRNDPNEPVKIGRHNHIQGPFDAKGMVDDLAVYSRVLSASELQQLAGVRSLYRFDEVSGDTVVDSVGAWNGTLMNGATREASSPWGGSALKLDGVDDYVSIDKTLLHDLPQGTIAANVYCDPSNNQMFTIVSQGDTTYTALVFGIGTDGRPSAAMVSPSYQAQYLTSPDPVPMNTWVQLALTWDGAVWRIYVNGVPNGEVASTVTPRNDPNEPVKIGRHNHIQGPFYAKGMVDNLTVRARALSAAELQALSKSGPARIPVPAGTTRFYRVVKP